MPVVLRAPSVVQATEGDGLGFGAEGPVHRAGFAPRRAAQGGAKLQILPTGSCLCHRFLQAHRLFLRVPEKLTSNGKAQKTPIAYHIHREVMGVFTRVVVGV